MNVTANGRSGERVCLSICALIERVKDEASADRLIEAVQAFKILLRARIKPARLFIGGPDAPSPTIADALHGDVPLLEVQCRHCSHGEVVDLSLVIWPRDR